MFSKSKLPLPARGGHFTSALICAAVTEGYQEYYCLLHQHEVKQAGTNPEYVVQESFQYLSKQEFLQLNS